MRAFRKNKKQIQEEKARVIANIVKESFEKLRTEEGKIENGTLKFIPFKVGEIMYEVIEGMPIQEWEIESISFNRIDPDGVIWAQRKRDYAHCKFWIEDLGTKFFATKPEAEAKLRELKGE